MTFFEPHRYRYLWVATDVDEYELPVAVCDSQKELANVLGVSVGFVSQAVNGYDDKHFAYNIYKIKK